MTKKNAAAAKPSRDGTADVISVREAGRRLGLSKNTAYAAANRGEIPVIRIGSLLKVPRVAFERMLEGVTAKSA